MLEWLKWQIAKKEMAELDRWRIEWHDHRRWFAEFPVTATAFDHLKARVEDAMDRMVRNVIGTHYGAASAAVGHALKEAARDMIKAKA